MVTVTHTLSGLKYLEVHELLMDFLNFVTIYNYNNQQDNNSDFVKEYLRSIGYVSDNIGQVTVKPLEK